MDRWTGAASVVMQALYGTVEMRRKLSQLH